MLRKFIINYRLKKTMKPDPSYRERRLAQFDEQRKARYWLNVRLAGL